MSDTAITQKLCNCPEFPGENITCPVHYPVITDDELYDHLKDIPLDAVGLAFRVYNRELEPEHITEACWVIRNTYPSGGAPEWLTALAAGIPAEFEELADEVRDMLIFEVSGGTK